MLHCNGSRESKAHWSPRRCPWWFHQVSGTLFVASRERECTAPFSRVHLTGERAVCALHPDERLCPHYGSIIHKRDTKFRNLPPFQKRYVEETWRLPKHLYNCLPHVHEIHVLKGNVYFVGRKACFYNWICRDAETVGDRKYSLYTGWVSASVTVQWSPFSKPLQREGLREICLLQRASNSLSFWTAYRMTFWFGLVAWLMRFTSERVECWILSWVLLLACEYEQITRSSALTR